MVFFGIAFSVKAKEAWVDGSKDEKVSYSIFYGYDHPNNFQTMIPQCHPQTNNRAELLAAIIALEQAKEESTFTLYTDSEYVVIKLKKIIDHKWSQKSGNKNDDLWLIAESIIKERQNNSQTINVEHVNSHLLDKDAKCTVGNFDTKWINMHEKFGNDTLRILRGNQEADRMASEIQKEEIECLGMEVNDTAVKWVIASRQTFWNNIADFADWWKEEQKKLYKKKYPNEIRWSEDEMDVVATAKLHASLKYENMQTQNWSFKMNYNKVKTKVAVKDNPMMQFLTPNLQVYAQLGCPLGCQANEDIGHLC